MITVEHGELMPQDYELLVDGCWVRGCTNIITVRQLDTSTMCVHHEREMLDSMFGPPPKETQMYERKHR